MMSRVLPSTPRRGTFRGSHLRQVSNGSTGSSSSNTNTLSRPASSKSDTGTAQYAPVTERLVIERRCNLSVHNESFSKEEIVLNFDLVPGIKAGQLMAIVGLKTDNGVRDFQDKIFYKKDTENLTKDGQRERSSSNPRSLIHKGVDPKHDVDMGKRYVFIARDIPKELKAKSSTLEVSVLKQIADQFCFKNRATVLLIEADWESSSASHVQLSFKDEYLARSDMWRLAVGELSNKTVYKGQKIIFMGTIKATVTAVYVNGSKTQSAFFSTTTKPIFRSESARYVLFIQMSREMWDFDSEASGEIMFNKVTNGFLPALFKKWASLKAKHLVSIALFTRVEYDTGLTSELASSVHDSAYYTGVQTDGNKKPYKDFYRIVVSEMSSGSWTTILHELKHEFKSFRRDISMHRIDTVGTANSEIPDSNSRGVLGTQIEAQPSLAMHGNVLEAINLASSQFAHDYIDRDLMRTGISIVVITPSPGIFEVDYETLRLTTETLVGSGIGIDLVCLPKMPLHSVPLFKYRNPKRAQYDEDLRHRDLRSEDSTPLQNVPIPSLLGSSFNSLSESFPPSNASLPGRSGCSGRITSTEPPKEWSYAIPHWIDASYWTGAKQDPGLTTSITKGRSARAKYMKRFSSKPHPSLAIRCKLYELEMGSPGGSAESEISVTPLQHVYPFAESPGKVSDRSHKDLRFIDTSEFISRRRSYSSFLEYVGGPSKVPVHRDSSAHRKAFYNTLETYDSIKAELFLATIAGQRRNARDRFDRVATDEAMKKIFADDSKVFGTSFSDMHESAKGISFLEVSPTARTREPRQNENDFVKPRKKSIGSVMDNNAKPALLKLPKFGRQISLGKNGFGIAAPKATTAELQIENVSAGSTIQTPVKKRSTTITMASHLLISAASPIQEKPPSSHSISSKAETVTLISGKSSEGSAAAQPMTIKSALQGLDLPNQSKSRSLLGTHYEEAGRPGDLQGGHLLQSVRQEDSHKLDRSKLLAGSVPELPNTLSPTTAMAPWLSVLNPSNPSESDATGPSQYKRWQHVFPRPILTNTMKWKSLCCPASVPLTTEYFPTKNQLETEYQQKPYNISQNADDDLSENTKTREEFLRELIGLRLSQGFQVVIGQAVANAFGQKSMKIANVLDRDRIAEDGSSVFMSMGSTIHQLSCVNGTEVEINMFVRKPTVISLNARKPALSATYNPAIRTTLAQAYESRKVNLEKPRDEYNWNYVDAFIAGFEEEMTDNLRFWRARFVLIPVERPTQSQRQQGGDSEEEVRLEGIKKITQMWQRNRVITANERRFQTLASRKIKGPNPLDIVYRTEDPSVVVTAELETLPLIEGEGAPRRGQLIENERFKKAKLDILGLAEAIQAPVERGGVRMQNRRWHFQLHYNCFIGSDMTTWLIENFEDIETREGAVEFGNMLMAKDDYQKTKDNRDMEIFVHVEKHHPFRDGQYFYQVTGEYAKQRPESRSGWFGSRRRDMSVPFTPVSEIISRDSPRPEKIRSTSNQDENSSSGNSTPTTGGGVVKKPRVVLSKVMKYDVDQRKRSYRPERINLHYDRLHNPDNCYHIRIDWMGATAKLIEDAIESWAATAERYGLRLVEAPIGEACSITDIHPFRTPYAIKLALQPPDRQPKICFDLNSFGPQPSQATPTSRHYYQKAIMKKFNFVLDIEAAKNFPNNVDVTYSWGKPDYKYTQYIHRSGVILAQITDEGNFLLLANRLYNNRTSSARESDRFVKVDHTGSRISSAHNHDRNISPFASPVIRPVLTNMASPVARATPTNEVLPPLSNTRLATTITPGSIKDELEAFCCDAVLLEAFYMEVFERATPPSATPPQLRHAQHILDNNIPTLGLPPGILARDASPAPLRMSNLTGVSSPMPPLGRRTSVPVVAFPLTHDGVKDSMNSPRVSIAEDEERHV
ncbi:vacuolar membrane-associated protein-like protein IML1 [Calycina marina]|uniref:Vacuolar membrane-associated protein IML1 n=1 Tax=Calycina marina TaxID=1763456 RepID=A0A9P7YWZ8_9HELO|nr:vacuolar membrane-associated protein-like protein IML1 [Calycina marina]